MKYYKLASIATLLFLSACGSDNSEKDTDTDNIKEEKTSDDTQVEGKAKDDDESDAKSHFPISEDMSLNNSVIIDLPSDKLEETMNAKLLKIGKSLDNINSDGSIYIIGTASTGVPVNKNGFITSRSIAFSKAELRAKIQILKLAGEVVTSERNSALISKNVQGSDPDAVKKASFIEKVAKVADASLDKALTKLGVSEAEIKGMNEDQKEKRYSENFYNYVSSFVGSMIKGVSVIKIAEGEVGSSDYEVAVCVKYSPEQQSEAANFKNLGANQATMNSKVVENLKMLPPDKLVSKLGAQVFKDENGNRFVLGFGQSSIRKTTTRQSNAISIGRKKSRLQAVQNIKNFIAEDLVGKEISETVEKISEFQDGEQGLYTEENFSELIKSKRSSVKMNTFTIRNWQSVHPVSNSMIVGSIVILSEANNIQFKEEENSVNQNETQKSDYKVSEDIEGEEL